MELGLTERMSIGRSVSENFSGPEHPEGSNILEYGLRILEYGLRSDQWAPGRKLVHVPYVPCGRDSKPIRIRRVGNVHRSLRVDVCNVSPDSRFRGAQSQRITNVEYAK